MISCAEKRSRQGEAGRGPAPAATASLLLWLPWGCSGILSVPAVAMHSAVSGTLPLVEGFLGLREGWDTRKPYSGGSWGQLGLGGRGLCLGRWGAGQGIGHSRDPAARQGGTWACPWSWKLSAWRGWAHGSGSFPQARHRPEEWGPGPESSGQIRGLSFYCGSRPGSRTAPLSTS